MKNILVTVKPADKHRRAYKRMISARLHRGFQMFRSPMKDLSETKVYQPALQQETRLNVSSGEDAFLEMSCV